MLGLGICFLTMLIFGLLGVGRRVDRGEERISKIMSSASLNDVRAPEDTVNAQMQRASPPISVSKVSTAE